MKKGVYRVELVWVEFDSAILEGFVFKGCNVNVKSGSCFEGVLVSESSVFRGVF